VSDKSRSIRTVLTIEAEKPGMNEKEEEVKGRPEVQVIRHKGGTRRKVKRDEQGEGGSYVSVLQTCCSSLS
jgi:hypothetical protein